MDLLYNWAANDPVPASSSYYPQELGLENKVIYLYGGNIGHAQDMMNIVRLAKAMRSEPNAHFVLVGAGDFLYRRLLIAFYLNALRSYATPRRHATTQFLSSIYMD